MKSRVSDDSDDDIDVHQGTNNEERGSMRKNDYRVSEDSFGRPRVCKGN